MDLILAVISHAGGIYARYHEHCKTFVVVQLSEDSGGPKVITTGFVGLYPRLSLF